MVSPVAESSLSSSARSIGFAADAAECWKAVNYANNSASQGIQFIMLAQETLGGWSTQAGKILSLLADRIADRGSNAPPAARPYSASSASLPSGA
jgi:hypothetical protein